MSLFAGFSLLPLQNTPACHGRSSCSALPCPVEWRRFAGSRSLFCHMVRAVMSSVMLRPLSLLPIAPFPPSPTAQPHHTPAVDSHPACRSNFGTSCLSFIVRVRSHAGLTTFTAHPCPRRRHPPAAQSCPCSCCPPSGHALRPPLPAETPCQR